MIKSLNSTGLEKRLSGEWGAKGSLGYCVRRASCRVQWKSAWCSHAIVAGVHSGQWRSWRGVFVQLRVSMGRSWLMVRKRRRESLASGVRGGDVVRPVWMM